MDDDALIGLKIHVSCYKESIKVIAFGGSFTLHSYSQREPQLLRELTDTRYRLILLDFTELRFLTSFAISKIIAFYRITHDHHVDLAFYRPSAQVLNVLQMTNLSHYMKVFFSYGDVEAHFLACGGALPAAESAPAESAPVEAVR